MPLIDLSFAPTIDKNKTPYSAEGAYVSCDKVRFRNEEAETIGGWIKATSEKNEDYNSETTFLGTPRQLFTWADLLGDKYIVSGSDKKVEIVSNNTVYDVTPIVTQTTAEASVTSTELDRVRITLPSHDTSAGDFVVLADFGSVSLGGVATADLAKQYEVVSIVDTNVFKVSAAVSSASVLGSSVVVSRLLPNGTSDNTFLFGFGTGTFGTPGVSASAGWGDPRGDSSGGLEQKLRQWSFSAWGEDLLASPRGGALYVWDKTNGLNSSLVDRSDVRLAEVTTAPSKNEFMTLSEASRQAMVFGTEDAITSVFDPLLIRWSDFENYTVWESTVSNGAGDYRIPSGNAFTYVNNTKRETLIVTENPVYVAQFVGQPDIFAFDKVGDNAPAVSKNAGVEVQGRVIWMGFNSFFEYSGTVNILPCTLEQWLFNEDSEGSINFEQKDKIYAGTNNLFNEVWWHYPSRDSTEVDRYVSFNYEEGSWTFGTLARTTWEDFGSDNKPIATGVSGDLYFHESGRTADGSPIKHFIVTSFFDMGEGDDLQFVDRLIPDIRSEKAVNFTICAKKFVQDSVISEKGPFAIAPTQKKQDFRIRGRTLKVRYSTSLTDTFWQLGKNRIRLQPDGGR